jgi:DNA-binding CsgD family transcriptional regulator
VGSIKKVVAPTWRAEFDRAYDQGQFKKAAGIYDAKARTAEPPELILQAARAHMHGDPASALRLLLKLRSPGLRLEDQIQRDALLTEAFARTKDFKSADQRLEAALGASGKLSDADLVAIVGYRGVRRHLLEHDTDKARGYLTFLRAGRSQRARTYAAFSEAIILGYEERVLEQAVRLTELLRSLDAQSTEFVEIRAWSTHTLAALARELYVPEAIPEIDRQLTGARWPEDFAPNHFQALRGLAWAKALQGDYFNAFRHLKRSSEVADSPAWRVLAACDRSHLARHFSEHRWSRVELDEAEQLAGSVDWHATLAEERMGLLSLAELFGDLDTAKSAMYLARYRELGEVKSPLHYGSDPRRTAYAQYSTGVIELSLGNKKRGLVELREARTVFERFGYDFRVALCLVAEFKTTGDHDLLPAIDEKLRNYRQSWLMSELQTTATVPGKSLPPMQQRVFDQLCQGRTTSEIAQLFGRSEYTISNHIKAIFKTFGVKSRSALIAEAVRRGLIKPG